MDKTKPVVALTLGDAAGIGSELIAKLLTQPDITAKAHIALIADSWQWQQGKAIAGVQIELPKVNTFADAIDYSDSPVFIERHTLEQSEVALCENSPQCGTATLNILTECMDAALAGIVDAICFAPLNKHSMKMGGLEHEDELHFFAAYLDVDHYFCEFNTSGDLWTSRISSHIPLKDAHQYITVANIKAASFLIYDALKLAGYESPRVAVAAFNPHAGEGGTCGREEIDIIEPAVRACRDNGYPISGPFPADTIFIKVQNKAIDAVVTMYHDQGQIAIKLMGFTRGVTVHGGLPIPITTPAHGTAFDIAGQGIANVMPMRKAFDIACSMGANQLNKQTT